MKYKILFFSVSIFLPAAVFLMARPIKNKVPVDEMIRANKLITKARSENSPDFAKPYFELAKNNYDSAMMEWYRQNEKFILFRNYQKVTYWALQSIENSEMSVSKAIQNKKNTQELTRIRINTIADQFDKMKLILDNLPENKQMRHDITLCKIQYSESLQAFKNKNFSICNSKLESVENTLNQMFNNHQKLLIDFFKAYPHWHQTVESVIHQSKKNKSYVLVVDKFARKLFVYKNGELLNEYVIEIGINWLGNKQEQGDKATPEGLYKIIDKKQNGHTKYYKALLLNYPNDDDVKRFAHNKKLGLIKNSATIGNLIEIHGNGGKGTNWTDGCIALNDEDIDQLFRLCPTGTSVAIVGSTKPISELSFPLLQ
ncbi:MAG: hypothetical protein CVU09_13590 [Bacteroidetes bacterium HGW-Bacteroidetes-4]|jgi:uncharacterized membrane protein YwzB|nr:MAG: hypothetical protein CVU09_13590 [Bacteroidetes bacterium HGW-Bacteroidetes-4]